MPSYRRSFSLIIAFCALPLAMCLSGLLSAKEKAPTIDPNDITLRLYQLLDTSYAGKLLDFYVIGDVFKDPKNPDHELQHIFKVDYDKGNSFGRFRLYVRSLDKLTPGQLKDYTPKQVYEFGDSDVERFTKTDPGPFGKAGDVYFQAMADGAIASAPITDEARKAYETYVTQWILPALEKR